MVVVASTCIATEREHRVLLTKMMIAMPTPLSLHTTSCVRWPSCRDKRFSTEPNGAAEHPRKTADVKSVSD